MAQMIDWFRGSIPYLHDPINGGHLLSVAPDGSLEWDSVKAVDVKGSHDSNLRIRSKGSDGEGRATHLWIDGNISKFLQGHNLFGSCDLIDLVYKSFTKLLEFFPALKSDLLSMASAEQAILDGDFEVKALDINQIYRLDNDRSVESWLYAAEMHASKRAGRTTSTRGTVYLGKNSRRWSMKFYNKFREMKKHQNRDFPQLDKLLHFAEGVLRIELRLLSLELKDLQLTKGYQFTEAVIADLFNEYMRKFDMNTNAVLVENELLELPRSVQATYHLWKSGVSCREMLSKPTFYRHRRILKEHGIDINFPPISPERNNVVPLVRIVEAVPIAIPQWAFDYQLIA